MSTILTYILAALGGALVATGVYPIAMWLLGLPLAPSSEVDLASEAQVFWVLFTVFSGTFVALFLVGSPIWALARRSALLTFGANNLIACLLTGAAATLSAVSAASFAFIFPVLHEFGIGPQTAVGRSTMVQFLSSWMLHPVLLLGVVGAAWGSVFWFRESTGKQALGSPA